jgi:hypothetical protein
MHVSRGLAGMHPIRLGSRPEITRLVIRSPKCISTREAAQRQEAGDITSRVEARPRRNP